MDLRRRIGTLVLTAALTTTLSAALAEPAAAVSRCNDGTSNRAANWYDGLSAGYIYDRLFGAGPRIPGLPSYIPQSLAVWPGWNGGSDALLLIGAYDYPNRSRIYGVSLRNGRHVGTVEVPESHMGGMAIVNGWLLLKGDGDGDEEMQTVMKFRLHRIRNAMKAPGIPFLRSGGKPQKVYGGSFYASYGGQLWAGRFDYEADKMYRYNVSSTGWLRRVGGAYKVPANTQGLVVTKDRFVFSTSDGENRGRMYVVKRTHNYQTAKGRCFRIPSLAQGMAVHNGTLYMTFEGAASPYLGWARNKVARVHKAPLSRLTQLG